MSDNERLFPDVVVFDLAAHTKAEVLEALSEQLAAILGRDGGEIARALVDRERLGSTGVGSGVALPHADVSGLGHPFALFARLARPIDWDAIDEQPVDLVVVVLSSSLQAGGEPGPLARSARVLRNPEARRTLAACTDLAQVHRVFAQGG